MDWGHVLTLAGMVAGATWLIHGKLGDLNAAFRVYAAKNESEHDAIRRDVIDLQKARKGRR